MTWTPLIGRTAEFARLRAVWEDAKSGERHVVFVSGEPGIGKTRLALEFAREVERTDAIVLYGRCDEDPVVPYEPFVQALEQLASGSTPEPSVVEFARSALTDLVPALSRRPGSGSPPSSDSATERLLLFEAVRSLLRGTGSRAPLLLVLDDLHNASADTVRLVRYLTRGSWGTPAVVLGIFRDTEPSLAIGPLRAAIADLHIDGLLERIELRALEVEQVRTFVEMRRGSSVTEEEARRLHDASGGNPFFMQELVALADADDDARFAPPVSVREVIARRLSKLSPSAFDVLVRAAILGSTAEIALLRALGDGDDAVLDAGLGEAEHAGLLVEARTNYQFSHGLVRQALIHELPFAQRQQLHLRSARAIVSQAHRNADERTLRIAAHLRAAGDAATPGEALPHAFAAAEAALASHAEDDAIHWWEWALDLMGALGCAPGERAALLERMAEVLDTSREQVRATQYLQRALLLRQETGDALEIAAAQCRLGYAHAAGNLRNTDLATARACFSAATASLTDAPRPQLAALHAGWARMGVSSFRIEDLRHAELARDLSDELESGSATLRTRVRLGALGFHSGDIGQAMRHLEAVLQMARARGDVVLSGLAAFMAGIFAQRLSDPFRAIELLRPELDGWPAPAAAAPWGIASRLVSALADAGDMATIEALAPRHTARDAERIEAFVERSALAFYNGAWDGPTWEQAEALAAGAALRDDRCSRQNLGHWLVRVYRARGEPERASAFVEEELACAVQGGSVAQEFVAGAELALLSAEAGAAIEAMAHVSRCREIFARAADRRGLDGKLLLADALVTALAKGPAAATATFEQAVDVFRCYSTPWLETRAFEDWAEALLRARRRRDAASKRRHAEAIYRKIGAGQPWLDRITKMGGTGGGDLPDGLTSREVEVLRLIARGQSNGQIAAELVLSVRTVERHIANIYEKASVHTKSQATAYAFGHNLS